MFEIAMVDKQSVFEPLKFYCNMELSHVQLILNKAYFKHSNKKSLHEKKMLEAI